jgi:hypothetical protein
MPGEKPQGAEESTAVSLEDVQNILDIVLKIPIWWWVPSALLILLSTIGITRDPSKGWTVSFTATATTALFFALLLFPAMLKIFALAGGALKGGGMEVSGAGLLSLLRMRLGSAIEDTERIEEKSSPEVGSEARQIRQTLQGIYVSATPNSSWEGRRNQLRELAQQYDNIRKKEPSGSLRTQLLKVN